MTDTEVDQATQSLRRTGHRFLIVVVLLGLGLLYNGYQTFDLSQDTRENIRGAQILACERSNMRIHESNRRVRAERVALDASVVVAGLAPDAYARLGIPPTVEALRLQTIETQDIREMRGALRQLPTVNCEAAIPPLD